MTSSLLLALLASVAPLAAAHGHVTGIVAAGKYFTGYTPNFQYMNPKPKVPAWSAGGYGQGGIVADAYNKIDIVCHDNAKPGEAYATVPAGSKIDIQWSPWAESHHGPVMDYLAPCPGDCLTLRDGSGLKFTKIAESGLITPGPPSSYVWATDVMRKRNNTWSVTIPAGLKEGNYVLRNEIIALHTAGTVGGAQNYPQCFNVKVTGGGGKGLPGGGGAMQLYKPEAKGIVFNIAANVASYPIPGPPVWKG
ncbi:glycoside hydrolase [Trichodelitschia bisporula]|uniref:Glycoside hydrolase n=1 Tax=Trichodelitschia bisporula TaxID=703511 RepID=A0A6G1HV40_9PEZI|nr:glycoside hydrolase [Trichodelitschia bisporula]